MTERIYKRVERFNPMRHERSSLYLAVQDSIETLDTDREKIEKLTNFVAALAQRMLNHNLLTEDEIQLMLPFDYKIGVEGLDYD